MKKDRKEQLKVFRIVSLGERMLPQDIAELLQKEITLNPEKPDIFFTVEECSPEDIKSLPG